MTAVLEHANATEADCSVEDRRASKRFAVGARDVPARLEVGVENFPAFLQDWSTSGFRVLIDNVDRWRALPDQPERGYLEVWGSRFAVSYVREYTERNRLCICLDQRLDPHNPGSMMVPLGDEAASQSRDQTRASQGEDGGDSTFFKQSERPDHSLAMRVATFAGVAAVAALLVHSFSQDAAELDQTVAAASTRVIGVANEVDSPQTTNAVMTPSANPSQRVVPDSPVLEPVAAAKLDWSGTLEPMARSRSEKRRTRRAAGSDAAPATMLYMNTSDIPSMVKHLRRQLAQIDSAVTLMFPVRTEDSASEHRLVLKELTPELSKSFREYLAAGSEISLEDVFAFLDRAAQSPVDSRTR